MKAKNLAVLALVAVVLIGLAVVSSRKQDTPPTLLGNAVLPELQVNDVTAIVMMSSEATNRLARLDGTWVSEANYRYPADFGRIKDALITLAELEVGQVIEASDADRVALQLVDPRNAATNTGTRVELLSADGSTLAALLIGTSRVRDAGERRGGYPDGQYVSPDDGKTVYLVAESLAQFSRDADAWLDKQLVHVPAAKLTSVTIAGPDREPLTLSVPEGGNALELADLGEDETLDRFLLNSVNGALSYLSFDAVADPWLDDKAMGFDKPVKFRAATKDGAAYTVTLGNSPDDSGSRYARIRAELLPEPVTAETPDPSADSTNRIDEATTNAEADARKALDQKLTTLNARLEPWTFILPAYKATGLLATREHLIKAKTPPAPAPEITPEPDVAPEPEATPEPTEPAPAPKTEADEPTTTPAEPASEGATS